MPKPTIIFDFDGTIANTLDSIVSIFNDIAPKFRCEKIDMKDRETLRARRPQDFLKDYGVTNWKLPFLLIKIRKELHSRIAEIEPITGIVDVLLALKKSGYSLGIMTSNSKENVQLFLDKNHLSQVFDFIYTGRNIFGKNKVIMKLLRDQNLSLDATIYVGDETRDVEAVKKIGMQMIAVSWGFNTREILMNANPDIVLDEPRELIEYLEKMKKF